MMMMRRWRVGSLTMGLVLILFGGVTLTSIIAGFSPVHILMTLWPVILICLGAEILLHLFVRKKEEEEVKLKYDVLSILFIGFLLFVSSIFCAFTYVTELYGSREALAEALGIRNDTVYEEYSQELPGADELVVFGGFYGQMTVLPATGGTIRVDYGIRVRTSDRDYARSVIGGIVAFENGQSAYMLYHANRFSGDRRLDWPQINWIIHLPEGKTLDLSQFAGAVEHHGLSEGQIIF